MAEYLRCLHPKLVTHYLCEALVQVFELFQVAVFPWCLPDASILGIWIRQGRILLPQQLVLPLVAKLDYAVCKFVPESPVEKAVVKSRRPVRGINVCIKFCLLECLSCEMRCVNFSFPCTHGLNPVSLVVVIACGGMGPPIDNLIDVNPVLTLQLVCYERRVLTGGVLSGALKCQMDSSSLPPHSKLPKGKRLMLIIQDGWGRTDSRWVFNAAETPIMDYITWCGLR